MNDIQAQINLLDTSYGKLSGMQIKGRGVVNGRERGWFEYVKAGFTLDDLEVTILWLKYRIRQGKRDIGCLRWSSLIGSLDRFQEELSMARAEKRNAKPPQTPLQAVQAMRERPAVENTVFQAQTAKPVSEWINELRKAASENQ